MKRKLTVITSVVCAAMMSLSLVACKNNKNNEAEVASYVSLDINPSIELTLDSENKVVSVVGTNEDGQVLLYGESGILGQDVEVAIDKITDLAVELGYLNEDNKVVEASVTANATVNAGDIQAKIDAKIKSSASENGLEVKVETLDSYSLNRKLDEFKAQYPNNAVIQALTIPQFKLALSAAETGEVTLEAAVSMNNDELIKLVSAAHKQIEEYATEAYNKAKAEAFSAYDIAAGLVLDGVYTEHYTKNMLAHPTTFYYGAAYQAYKISAVGFNAIADVLVFAESLSNYPLNEQRVAAVVEALGLSVETLDEIKDSNGNVTVNSVEAYADKVFKNMADSDEVAQMKAELTAALKYAELDIKEQIEKAIAKYGPQIEAIITSASAAVDTMKGALSLIPGSITTQVNATIALFEEVIVELEAILANGTLDDVTLRGYAVKLEGKAAELLTRIEADLSEDELAQIAARVEELSEKLASAKAAKEEALAKAEAAAKQQIETLKSRRTAA